MLRVTFLDVGQGDAAVIQTPDGRVALIDGGGYPGTDERDGDDPGNRIVVPFLRSQGIQAVDLIVPTHPDDDHVQGLVAVTQQMPVRAAWISGFDGKSAAYGRLLDEIKTRKIPVQIVRRGQRFSLGKATLEILHPAENPIEGTRSPTNDNSIVLRLIYGKTRILFTGDAEEAAEKTLFQSGADLRTDVLKVGHHGSRWSTSDPFLAAVRPKAAVISSGSHNVYGHPSKEVLTRLKRQKIRTFRTDTHGATTVETEGKTVRIRPFRTTEKVMMTSNYHFDLRRFQGLLSSRQ